MIKVDYLKRDKLLEYLNDIFIPNNLYEDNKIANYRVFSLVDNFSKYIEVMDYLKEKGITVVNQKVIFKEEEYNGIKQLGIQERNRMLLEYSQSKDRNILNKLFENHLHYAAYFAYKSMSKSYIDPEELYISAQEGLFYAIAHYNLEKKASFEEYANICMFSSINRNSKLNNTSYNISNEINNIKKIVEDRYGEQLSQNGDNYDRIVDDIIEFLVEPRNPFDSDSEEKLLDKYDVMNIININNPLSINQFNNSCELSVGDDDVFEDMYMNIAREILSDIFEEVSKISDGVKKQIEIFRFKSGFDDGIYKSYRETGRKFNIKHTTARIHDHKALLKVRNPKYIRKLRDFRK